MRIQPITPAAATGDSLAGSFRAMLADMKAKRPAPPAVPAPQPSVVVKLTATKEEYIRRLQAHDWAYEMADDYSVYRDGKREHDALADMRAHIDPDGSIWKSIAR